MASPGAVGRDSIPIIGRSEAFATAVDSLKQAVPRSVVIAGDIGIGKTCLTQQIANSLAGECTVVRLRGTTGTEHQPYAAIAPLLSDRPELPESPIDALHRAVGMMSDSSVLLVVDDAHWLDDHSALTISQLVTQRWCSAIIAFRVPHRIHDALVQLWKDDDAVRIDLAPLKLDDVAALAAAILGGVVAPLSVDGLVARTNGNPMFITELLWHARATSTVRSENGLKWIDLPNREAHAPESVPRRLAEFVTARLDRLGYDARRAISDIALAGGLPCVFAQRLFGLDVLLELEGSAWIATSEDDQNYAVAHPLYESVVVGATSRTQRSQCFERLIRASDGTIDVLQRARWLAASGLSFDRGLVRGAIAAAQAKSDIAATIELARWSYANEPDLKTGLILAHHLGRFGEVDANLELVDDLLSLATNDVERMLAVVSTAWALAIDDAMPAAIALLENEYSRCDDPLALGGIEGALTSIAQLSGDRAMTLEWGKRAMERSDNPWTRFRASIAMGYSARISGAFTEALQHAKTALAFDDAIATSMGSLPSEGLFVSAETHLEAGNLDAAQAELERLYVEATQAGHKFAIVDSRCGLAHVEAARGLVRTASVLARESVSLCDSIGRDQWTLQVSSGLAMCLMAMGEHVELDALERELATNRWRDIEFEHVLTVRAWRSAASGDFDGAIALNLEAAEFAERHHRSTVAQRCVHNCTRMGRPQPMAFTILGTPLEGERAELERRAADNWNVGAAAMVEIATSFESCGLMLDAAVAYHRARELAQQQGADSAVAELNEQLHRVASTCGLEMLTNGESLRNGSGITATATLLTARELEVARRAGAGQRSRRIATDLFVSPRTVDNHLSRVYTKLGIRGRDELEYALRDSGLLTDS